jgi:rRNA maturation protein Rpf1
MILITTSRRPNQRIRTFCHDLARVLPNSNRINRGKLNFRGIIDNTQVRNSDRLVIIEKWKRGFCKINFYTISPEINRFYPILYISNVITQNDIGSRTIHKKLVITIHPDASNNIHQVAYALSKFIELPIKHLKKDLPYQTSIHVSNVKKGWMKIALAKLPLLKEVGPILIVKKIVWENNDTTK